MHISGLVLPEWARLRTFLKGIVTVSHISGLYPLSYTLCPTLPFLPPQAWSGCEGLLHAGAPQRVAQNPFADSEWPGSSPKYNLLFFFVFFSFIDRTVYHTAREGKAQSEVVLEIKTNINLSVGSAYKPEDNAI